MNRFASTIPPILCGTNPPVPADSLPATLARWTWLEGKIKRFNLAYAAYDDGVRWPWISVGLRPRLRAMIERRQLRRLRRRAERKLRRVRRVAMRIADGMEGIGK